jgi:4-amino-4-deoxy-L-arabinose transferase-like glycosyltransferase
VTRLPIRLFSRAPYAVLAALVLGLAAFNLTFRLNREFVAEWDESLYAISAWEMQDSGQWVGFTTFGQLDYSNTKPPLNVWLLVLSFKAFGRGIVSMRVPSVVAAWLTVLALMLWARHRFGSSVALVAGTVLATTFGFLHVHSGRQANTDPLFTLLLLLIVITLSVEEHRPWQRLWLGPLLAASFLLRGMGVLMPLAIVVIVDVFCRREWRARLAPSACAIVLAAVPVGAWVWARYLLDGWLFFNGLVGYDFVARSVRVLDGHTGGPFYYLNILVKHHYDWLAAALVAAIVCPAIPTNVRTGLYFWRAEHRLPVVIFAWAASTLLIPTFMVTKVPWYLNTFYPLFALGIAGALVTAFRYVMETPPKRALMVPLAVVTFVAFGLAEGKLWAYSYHYRDLSRSAQGLLLEQRDRFAGHRVFRDRLDRGATFVAGLIGVRLEVAESTSEFLRVSQPGDFFLRSSPPHRRRYSVGVVRSMGEHWLVVHREPHTTPPFFRAPRVP